jgi:hypothetical protein
MEKNKSTIILISISVALVFGLGGFFLGKSFIKNNPIENENTLKEQFKEDVSEEQIEDLDEQKELVEQEENDDEKIVFDKTQANLKNASSNSCKKMISNLNFSTSLKNMYCYADMCYKNANGAISYFMSDFKETLEVMRNNKEYADDLINDKNSNGYVNDIYTLTLSNGKILVIKNGEESSKYYLSDIKDVKSFRVTYSVQDDNNYQLFVLHNNGIIYEYDFFYQKKKAVKIGIVYKNVVDFDIFEGLDYKDCVGKSEGQNIQIALHTKDNKTLFGKPY